MAMSADQIQGSIARILDGIQLTNDVRSALNYLVKTAPLLKDQEETMRLDCEPEHVDGQLSWMLRYYDVTEDQVRTCLSNAALPLPGGIEITPHVRKTLDEMVQETIRLETLGWAKTNKMVQIDEMNSPAENFMSASVKKSVNELIEIGTREINSAGPHYQFSWLDENYWCDKEQFIECLRQKESDTSSEPEM